MAKKDLRAAAAQGADLFFSNADAANNAHDIHNAHDAQGVEAVQATPHRAQDEQPAQLAATIQDMTAAMDAETAARQERKRRKAEERHVNVGLTPTGYDYCKIMGSITGKGMSRFIADIIDKEAATNNETYNKAKELVNNARG